MQNRGAANLFFIDFSSYQTITNQALLISQLKDKAVYLRAYGTSHTAADTNFVTNAKMFLANNIPSGGYYFATPTTDPATSKAEIEAQADQFIAILQSAYGTGRYGGLTPMLDVEAWDTTTPQKPMYYGITGSKLMSWIAYFRDYFFAKTGVRLGLYSNRYFLTDPTQGNLSGNDLDELKTMPFWLAEYDVYYPNNAKKENNVWYGGIFTGAFNINLNQYGDANDGEIQVDITNGNKVIHPDGRIFDVDIGTNAIFTHLEGTAIGTFQIMYVGSDWSRFPQASAGNTSHQFMVVKFNTSTGTWQYYPNSSTGYDFTINDNDCLMGEITKTVTTGGINSMTLYNPPAPDNLGGWTTYVAWQFKDTEPADAWGLSHVDNHVDLNRTDSFLRLFNESELSKLATVAIGTTLKKGTTAIATLTSIDGISVSADTIETTALDTTGGYRTFVGSLKDAGEVSISGYYSYTAHNTVLADFESGASNSYTIEFPDKGTTSGSKWTFTAIVTAFSTGADLEDLVSFEATLKVSGEPTLTAPV